MFSSVLQKANGYLFRMNNTGFIARRYLFSKKHISLITTLTTISITGVTLGTALLIVVLSVFNGFFDVIKDLLLASDPDIRIEATNNRYFKLEDNLSNQLQEVDGIHTISPYVVGKALLVFGDNESEVVEVKGIKEESFFQINDIANSISEGVYDVSVRNRRPGILLNESLLNYNGIGLGEEIALLSTSGMRRALTQISIPRSNRFNVRGAYSINQVASSPVVFVDLKAGQRLFGIRNNISGIDIKLVDHDSADQMKAVLSEKLGPDFTISTWYDLQGPLYDVMISEKWMAYFILIIIVVIAVLNILGSLTMIVIQKKRDISILVSMGYTSSSIKSIFRKQGLYIGLIGCGIGGILGFALAWIQNQYGLIKLSSAFIIDAYPAHIDLFDISIVLLGSLLLCIAASWYPAHQASLIKPSEALRYE